MKPGVMLINTSRGALVDTKAVIDGLKKRHVFGIDVY
jgi:D-lactate dehydrogenase